MEHEPPILPPAAIAALEQGRKIEAIKLLREASGLGLKEAKDAVEDHLAKNPSIKSRFDQASAGAGAGALRWLLALVAFGALIYAFLPR